MTLNPNLGCQKISGFTWSKLDLDESLNTLSFEKLAINSKEKEPSNSLSERDKYSRESRLRIRDGNVPLNWFEEISRTWSPVKLSKH